MNWGAMTVANGKMMHARRPPHGLLQRPRTDRWARVGSPYRLAGLGMGGVEGTEWGGRLRRVAHRAERERFFSVNLNTWS